MCLPFCICVCEHVSICTCVCGSGGGSGGAETQAPSLWIRSGRQGAQNLKSDVLGNRLTCLSLPTSQEVGVFWVLEGCQENESHASKSSPGGHKRSTEGSWGLILPACHLHKSPSQMHLLKNSLYWCGEQANRHMQSDSTQGCSCIGALAGPGAHKV